MLRVLARFVAACCALAFVLAAIGAVFFQAAGTRILQSPVYQRALAHERIYERAPGLAADLAIYAVRYRTHLPESAQGAFGVFAQFSRADWERMFGVILPASYLRSQGERALDQLVRSLHAETGPISVSISLVELKQRLVGAPAEEAFLAILQQRPPATPEQMQDAGALPAGRRPPDAMMPQVREQFRSGMRALVDQLPDTFDPFAVGPLPGVDRAVTALEDARDTLLVIERWAPWAPALPALLLLLIALFGVRSLCGWLLWWGIPCLIAGALAALLALPVVPATRWVFTVLVAPYFPPSAPSDLFEACFGVMTAVAQEIMHAALISAAWVAGAGLLCVILASFCRRRVPAADAPA